MIIKNIDYIDLKLAAGAIMTKQAMLNWIEFLRPHRGLSISQKATAQVIIAMAEVIREPRPL